MNRRRLLLVVIGLAAFAAGIGEMLSVRVVPSPPGETIVYLLGLVPLALAYAVVRSRLGSTVDRADTPDPEVLVPTPQPGDDVRRTLADVAGTRGRYVGTGTRWRLRDVAVAVLTRYSDATPAEARERVEAGTWTPNEIAAAFVGGREGRPAPLAERARSFLRWESYFDRAVRETVGSIAAVAGIEARDGGERDGPWPWADGPRGVPDEGAGSASPRDGSAADSAYGDGPRVVAARRTGRWRGVIAAALVSVSVGIFAQSPAVALSGVVGIGYAAYARAGAPPGVDLALSRTVSDGRPSPGETVTVTAAVENRGDRAVPDLRFVDGVPAGLAVTEGSPRFATALGPGKTHRVRYEVTARRGHHEFEPALALTRDLPGTAEREVRLAAATTLTCLPEPEAPLAPYPLRERATRYAGRVRTSTAGDGSEFFATREYRPGDPPGRIDWNRRARTGEFATLQFRSQRAARAVIVVDARAAAYRSPDPGGEHAVDRAVDAAARLFAAMDSDGHRVGIAALSPEPCWLAPAAGTEHRTRALRLLGTHPAFSSSPPAGGTYSRRWIEEFRLRAPGDVQSLVVSPLCDQTAATAARRLDAAGHPVTVLSPDPTADRTPGHRLARVGRRIRITDLRRAGLPVVDWAWDEPLDAALARHEGR